MKCGIRLCGIRYSKHRIAVPLVGVSLTLLSLVGCGGAPQEKFYPVAGTVRVNDKPVTVGSVTYRPDSSKGNASQHHPIGNIDASGNYELYTMGRKGAPAGWYKVLIFADENTLHEGTSSRPLPPKWIVHKKYTDERTTDVSVEVVESPAAGAYDLKLTK